MADWKRKFRKGKFRGIEFFTSAHEFQSGRRNVEHEFPKRNEGNTEDLGKHLPRYNLNIYVLGDRYFAKRDALIKALDADGPGPLIHPYLGAKSVQVGKYSLSETVQEGRIARFSVEFITAGVDVFPSENLDPLQAILNAVNNVLDATEDAFDAAFDVLNAPARVAEAALDLVDDVADRIENIAKKAGNVADGIAAVGLSIRDLKADASDLIRTPSKLASRFKDAFSLLFDAFDDKKALSKALSSGTSSISYPEIPGTETPTVKKLKGNQLAIQNVAIEISIASQARAAIEGNYLSVDESIDVKELIGLVIENQLLNVSDDDLFQILKDLQVAVDKGLPPPDVGELISYVPPKTLPALVVCHNIFGNIEKESEIVSQNKIRHPGFVPGRIPVEVSSD